MTLTNMAESITGVYKTKNGKNQQLTNCNQYLTILVTTMNVALTGLYVPVT